MSRKFKSSVSLKGQVLTELQGRTEEVEHFFQRLEKEYPVRIALRGRSLQVKGGKDGVEEVVSILTDYVDRLMESGRNNSPSGRAVEKQGREKLKPQSVLFYTPRGKEVGPVTEAQQAYLHAMEKYDIVFAEGPAGTGKTHLAVAYGCYLLKEQKVSRLILTRPAVEAGEKLGFLPGDIMAKIEPYFRPIYDALFELLDPDLYTRFMERGIIEVAPLAYMRGRTLNDAFIILDEAQNTTPEQMKMFLTRLGRDSSAVVTGDVTQVDIVTGKVSGLIEAMEVLKETEGIGFVRFGKKDVIRHLLVQKIIAAYEKASARKEPDSEEGKNEVEKGRT